MAKIFTKKGIRRFVLLLLVLMPFVITFVPFVFFVNQGASGGYKDSYFFASLNRCFYWGWGLDYSTGDLISNVDSHWNPWFVMGCSIRGYHPFAESGYWLNLPLFNEKWFVDFLQNIGLWVDAFEDFNLNSNAFIYWFVGVFVYEVSIVVYYEIAIILIKIVLIPLHVVDWFTEKVGGSHD